MRLQKPFKLHDACTALLDPLKALVGRVVVGHHSAPRALNTDTYAKPQNIIQELTLTITNMEQ